MNQKLSETISQFSENDISEERREVLRPLIGYISQKLAQEQIIRLNFICTHNSRRSHFSQIWAQSMAFHFGLKSIVCYSGGTEVTALFPKVAETLAMQGFNIEILNKNVNPVYAIRFAENEHPVIGFSKKYDHPFNPASDFCAVMTCSSADQGCPFIPGAEKRFAVQFADPKVFDGTDQMDEKYAERSLEIGREMWFMMKHVQ